MSETKISARLGIGHTLKLWRFNFSQILVQVHSVPEISARSLFKKNILVQKDSIHTHRRYT